MEDVRRYRLPPIFINTILSLRPTLTVMTSHGVPGHNHEEILSVFSDEMRNMLTATCTLLPPHVQMRISPQYQMKLEPQGTAPTIPDSVLLARINMVLVHLMWIEVCFSQTTNNVFNKVGSILCP